jgi:tight adherence protein C
MVILIALLIAISLGAFLLWAFRVNVVQSGLVRQLQTMPTAGELSASDPLLRRRRQEQSEKLKEILQNIGTRFESGRESSLVRDQLIHAGYDSPNAPAIYFGTRVTLALGLGFLVFMVLQVAAVPQLGALVGALWGAAMGWIMPSFYVGAKIKNRQKEMIKALPDALDLLVVCVEAGLGLNQALVRVAEEIGAVSPVLGQQFHLANLEMRSGVPREDALRNLADRTGIEDIQSFVTMLIQTDRFGTAIADALRIHSDTLRTKRRQRAEEAAAKTAIKMLFPLVFFIFPALFVVILGPAVIQVIETLGTVK